MRLVGGALFALGRGGAAARRLAHGGSDRGPGGGRRPCPPRSPRGLAPYRHRRGVLQAWPPLFDRDRGPRHGPAGVGRSGRNKKTLNRFFDALGKSGCARLREVSADGAEWISDVVGSRCLNARLVMDALY